MGLWDYISSTANSVNQNAIKPLNNFGFTSFSYASDAFTKISSAAVQNLSHSLHDHDTRSKMGQFATNFAKNTALLACREGLKTFPALYKGLSTVKNRGEVRFHRRNHFIEGGGPFVDIITRSMPEYKTIKNHKKEEIMELKSEVEDQKEKIKKLQALVDKMGKEHSSFKRE